jgi:TPP-dependent pyruvate/acetoin dehydrogenase alpha subunit
MSAETGIFHECVKYAQGHDLPITFVVEDNGMSVETPTREVWGNNAEYGNKVIRYKYERTWPHQGSGKWVTF